MEKKFPSLNSPKVSVIIPVYNVENYLKECLDSVQKQTLKDIEIICIDDGSTDSSSEILKEYAAKDKRIKVIFKENEGVGKARNNGILAAQGEFVAFMDSDDAYPNKKVLETLYNQALKHNVQICGGEFSLFTDNVRKLDQNFEDTFQGYLFDKDGEMEYKDYQFDYGYHRFIYNRQMLLEYEVFYPPYKRYQDPPFFVKAMITAGKFYAVDQATYAYRVGHKQINWTAEKIMDLLSGLKDNFDMAQTHHLEHLSNLTFHRFVQHYEQIKGGLAKRKVQKKLRKLCKDNTDLANFCAQNKVFDKNQFDDNAERHSSSIKLFGFLPLCRWNQHGGRETWSILGLPLFKKRRFEDGVITKYYILGLPVLVKTTLL